MFGLGERMRGGYAPTFNIHIKTWPSGGQIDHCYPDSGYFESAVAELGDNGVCFEDLHWDNARDDIIRN